MFKRLSLLASCLAFLFFAFAARADEWNKKTILTFNQPVELPGVVLPAGTYVFKLVDLPGARDIVQVFNQNENQLFATIIAIPHLHPVAHEKPYIGFEERPSNAPVAIHEWFYPGEVSGLEFVYPKTRAVQLARETHQPVLAAEVKPSETPVELQTEIVVEVTPENKEVQIAENYEPAVPPPLVVEERREEVIVETLPSTASPLFLIGLGGVLSLMIAAGIKRVSVIK
jgi:hypothetical protein